MKAIVYDKSLQKTEVKEYPFPEMYSGDEVVFYPKFAAICGSDLHMYMGHKGYDWVADILILGHEVTGKLEGDDDYYVLNPYIPCNKCALCAIGSPNLCAGPEGKVGKDQPPYSLQYGFRKDGGMAEAIAVKKGNLVKVPKGLSALSAVIAESIAVSYRAIMEGLNVLGDDPPSTALVIGPGPIGLGAVFVLSQLSVKVAVVGLPTDLYRLEKAKKIGASYATFDAEELKNELKKWTRNMGVDMVIEASGSVEGWRMGLSYLRRGGVLVAVGISSQSISVGIREIVRGGVVFVGSYGVKQEDLTQVLNMIHSNDEISNCFIDKVFSIDEGIEAFEYAKRSTGKVVISIGG